METPKPKQPIPAHAKKVFSGVIFDIYQWDQIMFDGSTKVFEKAKRRDAAVVFPVLDNGKILMIKQEQPGRTPYMSGCGGRLEENEMADECAKRELLEESGYTASELILWKTIQPSIKVEYAVHYFIAKGCTKLQEQTLDGGEKVSLEEFDFDSFLEVMRTQKSGEKELICDIYEAFLDTEKYAQLRELFTPMKK